MAQISDYDIGIIANEVVMAVPSSDAAMNVWAANRCEAAIREALFVLPDRTEILRTLHRSQRALGGRGYCAWCGREDICKADCQIAVAIGAEREQS